MAIQRFDSINVDDTTLSQSGVGSSGLSTPNPNDVGDVTQDNGTLSNLFLLNISSNQTGFTTLVDGESVGDSKQIRITRDSLAKGSKRIEVQKTGYSNNEYYIVEMVDDGGAIIDNPLISRALGIGTKDIIITKYTKTPNRILDVPKSIKNDVSYNLSFNFIKVKDDIRIEESTKYNIKFSISGKGSPVSILKNGIKSAEFFPKSGISEYEDIEGTRYTIRSSDSSLYRITKIYFNNEQLTANFGESLQLDVTLKDNYYFQIETEEISQGTAARDPQIQLVKDGAREYNINSKAGVPLMFRKNSDVEAITVIVGEDVLEFDDLDKGDLCGITIPHSVFKNIGKYNVKIFPFSFDDYENQVRPAVPAERVETKKVTKNKIVKEEVVQEKPKVEDKYNKYKPKTGGGGRPVSLDSTEPTNPFTNDGSFVNRPVDNRNIR